MPDATKSILSTEPKGGWWTRSCPVCGGDRWLDPERGVGLSGGPAWVCILCGRHEPARQAQLDLFGARGAA